MQSYLAHCLMMHALEPDYAQKAARHYAKLDPYRLADLPELLKAAMTALNASSASMDKSVFPTRPIQKE